MKPLRVLVIEDDGMISLLLTLLLEDLGYDVCACEATEDGAVAAAARTQPDLVIADINLLEGSGTAAVDRITMMRPTPHIFTSAYIDAVRTSRPDAVMIQKPYQVHELEQAISKAMAVTAHK